MSSVTSVTDVQWSFKGDTSWIDFDKKVNLKLENDYHAGKVKEVKVDKERYVELGLTVSSLLLF